MTTMNVKDATGATVAIEKPLAPSRAAAASSRPVVLSTEDKAAVDLLHTDLIAATPAGANLIGKIKTKFIVAAASVYTRPANQTPYAANDQVANSATAASVAAISFSLSDVNDDTVTLERIRILSTDTGVQGKSFRIWLFNSDPTANSGVGGGDNVAWSQKQAGFIGSMSGTFRAFSDGAGAVCVPDEGSRIITTPVTGAKTIYALMQTLDIFTSSAISTTFTLTAEGFQGAA